MREILLDKPVQVLGMMPSDVGHSIGQSLTVEGSGVMHRHFQVFYFNGKILGFFADFFRSSLNSFSKQFSKTFPVPNLLNRGNDGLGISPGEFYAIGVLLGNESLLKTFHSKADD